MVMSAFVSNPNGIARGAYALGATLYFAPVNPTFAGFRGVLGGPGGHSVPGRCYFAGGALGGITALMGELLETLLGVALACAIAAAVIGAGYMLMSL